MADSMECKICLEFYSGFPNDRFVSTIPCGHVFHKMCIERAFQEAGGARYCPCDRTPIAAPGGLLMLNGILPTKRERKFTLAALGDQGVGKTSLTRRFCWFKTLLVGDETVKLTIWDTSGEERWKSLTPQYIRKAQGIVIAYDSNCTATLDSVPDWFTWAERYAPLAVKILVGTKKDLSECSHCFGQPCTKPTKAGIEQLAERLHFLAFETSAAHDMGVDIAYRALTGQILDNRDLRRDAYMEVLARGASNHEGGQQRFQLHEGRRVIPSWRNKLMAKCGCYI